MITAIYARKSTEQERGESGDSLSIEERIAGAKAFITERGWPLGPVIKDEAVSGWTVPLEERPGGKAQPSRARVGTHFSARGIGAQGARAALVAPRSGPTGGQGSWDRVLTGRLSVRCTQRSTIHPHLRWKTPCKN